MKFSVLLFLSLWLNVCLADAEVYVKKTARSFPVGETAKLFVDTRFGTINLYQWEEDSIRLEAVIEVEQDNAGQAAVLLGGINLGFEAWNEIVRVTTVFHQDLNTDPGVKIGIDLFVPEHIIVDMANKYGNIDVTEYNAYNNLRLSTVYGNLSIGHIRTSADSKVSLNVSYGKMKIESCRNADLAISYGEVDVIHATDLKIRAEKSEIDIVGVDSLNFEGNYNHCHVGRCGLFYATGIERCTLRLDTVNDGLYARTQNSNLIVNRVGENFNKVDIIGVGGSCVLGLPGKKAHNFELAIDGGEMDIESLYRQESVWVDVDGFNTIKMYYLDNSEVNPLVRIRTKDCNIRVKLTDVEESE